MISNRALAKQYGYDESTVRQWIEKGMPIGESVDVTCSPLISTPRY